MASAEAITATSEMKKLTQETGGRVIEVGNKIDKLRQAFDQISQELRSQYNIGYTPTNAARDGSFRKVEIKPKQGRLQDPGPQRVLRHAAARRLTTAEGLVT
jgi:VWFA-related protein